MTVDTEPLDSPGPAAPPLAEAWLQVSAQLGDVASQVQGLRRDQARARAATAINHPAVAAGVVAADGTLVLDLAGPSRGREWIVRRLLVTDAANSLIPTAGTPTAASATFAGAAAGSVALPAGSSMSGFDITMVPAAAAVNGMVTVTGLATGTLSYDLSDSAASAGTLMVIRFPAPLAAATPATAPTVNVPAIAGGSGYAITVYGTTAATGVVSGTASLYAVPAPVFNPVNEVWALSSLPGRDRFTSETITVKAPERLYVTIAGGTVGQSITARVDVIDVPLGIAQEVEV